MENGVTWWDRSTMRTTGRIEYITPLQMVTESSTVPKSVMKTMVGGYLGTGAPCAHAHRPRASRKERTRTSSCLRGSPVSMARNSSRLSLVCKFEFQNPVSDFLSADSG